MLTHIHIRDFVIVDALELELNAGMTALTGETGAGKSILVDALGLVLGDRADSSVLRSGAQRAEIAATFDVEHNDFIHAWLSERDMDAGEECLLRRVISREGRSRGYINGCPVPNQLLRELAEHLVDIHGQHEHQSLLRREEQRALLDAYGKHSAMLEQLRDVHANWKAKADTLTQLQTSRQDQDARLDLLKYQVQELETLELRTGEVKNINEEHARLANAGQLLSFCQNALGELFDADESSLHSRLSHLQEDARTFAQTDAQLANTVELLNNACIQLDECVTELRNYSDSLELDPERLDWLESRIGQLVELGRKHRVNPEQLPEVLIRLQTELSDMDNSEQHLNELEAEVEQLDLAYQTLAKKLSSARKRAAKQLGLRVTEIMEQLGMAGGGFQPEVTYQKDAGYAPQGLDRIDFKVRTNQGQDFAPLNKVASGGELSRISLAIQVIASQDSSIPTLVFDEVDAGIGGGVAEVVGRYLRALGDNRQVLCVTHLAQVASQAHQHLQVSKSSDKDITTSGITQLEGEQRIDEVARMLGGIKITDSTRTHAREMIEMAQTAKNKKPVRKPRKEKVV